MSRRRAPRPGKWQYTVGETPHRLTAFERADRGNAIYSRVWDGKRYRDRKPLHPGIRDDAGKIVPELELEAQQAALERQRAVAAGIDDEVTRQGPITLAQGFRKLLDRKDGKYASATEWKQDMTRYAEVIKDALGAELLWSNLRHAHYRKLWRHLAHEHVKRGRHGLRSAEVIVGALQSAARWLQQEGWIEPGSALPAPGWKDTLRLEWTEITKVPAKEPEKPRYAPVEQRKLWFALPKADPRIALATEIGAELRLGQVVRSRRTDVIPHGGFRIGAVRVHGRGNKLGELVVLTMAQRHALTRALIDGHLADLEAAYQRGEIDDYYLLPGGYLRTVEGRRGKVRRSKVEDADKPLSRTALRKQWRELERLAGVAYQEGRGWYGMRRIQADLAEDVEDDARVLNRLGAWKHTQTRELYQEAGRTEIADRAKATRAKIRPNPRRDNALRGKKGEGEK